MSAVTICFFIHLTCTVQYTISSYVGVYKLLKCENSTFSERANRDSYQYCTCTTYMHNVIINRIKRNQPKPKPPTCRPRTSHMHQRRMAVPAGAGGPRQSDTTARSENGPNYCFHCATTSSCSTIAASSRPCEVQRGISPTAATNLPSPSAELSSMLRNFSTE
jgi:hypothetical protein